MADRDNEGKLSAMTLFTIEMKQVKPSEIRHVAASKYDLWRFWKVNQNVLVPRYKDVTIGKSFTSTSENVNDDDFARTNVDRICESILNSPL